jgi:hypothetical protein
MNILNQQSGESWTLANGDCVEVLNSLPENSIHLSIFSPPYASLYTYSNSDRDLGNSVNDEQFYEHFDYVIAGLHRVTKPGRIVCVDVMNIPAMKERESTQLHPIRDRRATPLHEKNSQPEEEKRDDPLPPAENGTHSAIQKITECARATEVSEHEQNGESHTKNGRDTPFRVSLQRRLPIFFRIPAVIRCFLSNILLASSHETYYITEEKGEKGSKLESRSLSVIALVTIRANLQSAHMPAIIILKQKNKLRG